MTKLKDVKIKTKLMVICLILVMIPVLVLGFASYSATKSGINEQSSVLLQQEVLLAKAQVESNYDMIQQKLISDLQVARSHYNEHLGYADRRTKRVAVHPDVINSFSDPGSLHSVLVGIAQKEGFNILTVTDTSGKVIARASSTKTGDTFVPDLVRKGTGSGFAATEVIGSQYIAQEGLSGRVGAGDDGMVLTSVHPLAVDGTTVGTVVGGYLLNYNYEIVDSVQSIVGGTATIFQDNLRISTNVMDTNGNRAVGTTISSTVYDTVVRDGKTYFGTAWVVNADYQTAYEPIKNSDGKAIGVLYVGVKQAEFQDDMMNSLAEVVIGKTGYVYILDTEGNYVLSGGRKRDGDNIWNAQDASGAYFIQEICNKGQALKGDDTFVQEYLWQNPGENKPRMKLAAIAYSPEFDWVMGASCYDEDFADPITAVRNVTLLISIIAIIAGVLIAYFFANSITRPLNEIMIGANKIRDGDFDYEVKVDSNDELGRLAVTFEEMKSDLRTIIAETGRLAGRAAEGDLTVRSEIDAKGEYRKVVGSVNALIDVISDAIVTTRATGRKVLGTAQGLASAAEEMNAGMEQLASASQQVAEGSQKLAELAQSASRNVADVASQIGQTSTNATNSAERAQDAVHKTHEVQEAAKQTLEGLTHIQEGVGRTSDTVSEMNTAIERVGEMGSVIADVADQTNMLGLNAAIEAARAGEAGKGFAVVADAVKNLAEKVKDAAGESGVAIGQIQESGENAISATGAAVDESARGGELLHIALDGVDDIVRSIDEVSSMVQEIDSGARNISEVVETVVANIDEVATVSEESASASEESSSAVEQQTSAIQELTAETQGLSDVAQAMMDELSRFTVKGGGS
ncbi:MAG: Sensory rhodopsin II transducer [Candidatus Methanogasteraceae archaeon]|nr:MAG: Sensory rhodopsin II transducer [ANME-2 cluster archaeon]